MGRKDDHIVESLMIILFDRINWISIKSESREKAIFQLFGCQLFLGITWGVSFDLRQTPHSLSVGFALNLCSPSQHVIRARRSKHVVQKNSINH